MNKIVIGIFVAVAVLLTATLVWINNDDNPGEKVLDYFNEHFFQGEGKLISVSPQDEDGREIEIEIQGDQIKLFLSPSEQYVYLNRFEMEDYMDIDDIAERVVSVVSEIVEEGMEVSVESISEKDKDGYEVVVSIDGNHLEFYVSPSGRYLFVPVPELLYKARFDINEVPFEDSEFQEPSVGFSPTGEEPCFEDGKPVIHYFGLSECPACKWEYPIVTEVMEMFNDYIVFYDRTDSDEDHEMMIKYNPDGYVPMLILGCSYYHIGPGQYAGEEGHKENIKEIICELTDNNPAELCI